MTNFIENGYFAIATFITDNNFMPFIHYDCDSYKLKETLFFNDAVKYLLVKMSNFSMA